MLFSGLQVVPVKASSSFLKGGRSYGCSWLTKASNPLSSCQGNLGVPKFCRYMLMFRKSCPAGSLHSNRHHTSRYLSFSLHCAFHLRLFSHSISSCSLFCLRVCIQNTPTLQKNSFHLALICVACVDSCFPLTKIYIIHLNDHIVTNPCRTQKKIFLMIYSTCCSFQCTKISLCQQAAKTSKSSPYSFEF